MKQISIKQILDLLENGVTRTTDSKGYSVALGSIEEKFELTKTEVKDIFKHPLLANKKTKPPKTYQLVDDISGEKEATPTATTPSYGARPASSSPSMSDVPVELPTSVKPEEKTEKEEVIPVNDDATTQESLA